jgi:hypothetical protein
MPPAFHVERLSDEFGQYTLMLTCGECRHERKADPQHTRPVVRLGCAARGCREPLALFKVRQEGLFDPRDSAA